MRGYALLEVADRDEAIRVTRRFLDHFGSDATCHLHEVKSPLENENAGARAAMAAASSP